MAKISQDDRDKPVVYYLPDGSLRAEHLPRYLPMWLLTSIMRWERYKAERGRDWYFYEIRLNINHPVDRKFADLWFIDHIERDHNAANPPLWHERILLFWLQWRYHNDLAWWNSLDGRKLSKKEWARVEQYGMRYYPVGFNASMRLIYHGCQPADYYAALTRQAELFQEEAERQQKEYDRYVRREKRRKAKLTQAKTKKSP